MLRKGIFGNAYIAITYQPKNISTAFFVQLFSRVKKVFAIIWRPCFAASRIVCTHRVDLRNEFWTKIHMRLTNRTVNKIREWMIRLSACCLWQKKFWHGYSYNAVELCFPRHWKYWVKSFIGWFQCYFDLNAHWNLVTLLSLRKRQKKYGPHFEYSKYALELSLNEPSKSLFLPTSCQMRWTARVWVHWDWFFE